MVKWHSLNVSEAFARLGSSAEGLSFSEARNKEKRFGLNVIQIGKKINPLTIFLKQFKSVLVVILIIAAIALFGIGMQSNDTNYIVDASLIALIVAVNGVFGFFQDFKAEKSIEQLKKMSQVKAIVRRRGKLVKVEARELVPGDVILVEEGSIVPADCKIVSAASLEVDESILTGESLPVSKNLPPLDEKTVLAERRNMLYMNTKAVRGKAEALVVETGMRTEVGKIAGQLQATEEKPTIFETEIDTLGKKIGLEIIVIIVFIAFVQLFVHAGNLVDILIISIALAVAAIPEGLPAVVTLSLAIGTKKMLKKNVLVRKLSVVESLGSVDVICSDKTGTLTAGRMKVREAWFFDKSVSLDKELAIEKQYRKTFDLIVEGSVLCNNVKEVSGKFTGNYTEVAFAEFALNHGHSKAILEKKYKRLKEIAFSHERKRMTTIHEFKAEKIAFMKGATETVLDCCTTYDERGIKKPLTKKAKEKILLREDEIASRGLRVIGFAYKKAEASVAEKEIEKDMVFLGLLAISDAPRKGVREAIKACKNAGIDVKMITGDKVATAQAIAKEIGFEKTIAMNGQDIESLTEQELREKVEEVQIFARVEPKHKTMILKALQQNGHVVAMTGDGVNDAAALKNADVGIAMGLRGTDVAKEASDLVLLDDNFLSIVDAVKQGRTIFNNIRKFVNYLLTSNFAEVFVLFSASLVGVLPITPIQLLIINFVTDGMPALALGADPPTANIMQQKPKKKGEGVINKRLAWLIAAIGTKKTAVILAVFFIGLALKGLAVAQTMAFAAFILYEFNRVAVIRWQEKLGFFSNKWLVAAMLASLAILLVLIYSPINALLGLQALGMLSWVILIAGTVFGWFSAIFITKQVIKRVPA